MTAPEHRTCCPTMKGQHHTCGQRAQRGATNRNKRGSSTTRRIRREWLVAAFPADVVRLIVRQASPRFPTDVEVGEIQHQDERGFIRAHDPELAPYVLEIPDDHPLAGSRIEPWQLYTLHEKPEDIPGALAHLASPLCQRQGVAMVAVVPVCRCYRCGKLLDATEVSPDKLQLQADGGGYARENIRPACLPCQSSTGGQAGAARKAAKPKPRKKP